MAMTSINASVRAQDATVPAGSGAGDAPLEPDHELPTPAPWRMTGGRWAGAVGTSLGVGVVGAGVGSLVGLLGTLNGTFDAGGNAVGALLIGGAVVGAAAGAIWFVNASRSAHEERENAKIQAEHGTATLEYARRMMSSFDHDDNGQIDMVNSTGLASQDERVFTEQRNQSRSHPKYDWYDDEWRTEREYWTETRGTSAAKVWTAADADPKDDVVTDVELARLMSQFDADRDGALTTSEQDAFRAAHPMIVDDWAR
jgi:hypothetical protein